ncbi:MAG: 50S ribosomal protein L23 [Ignavibacteriaceae bacterium]|nr:50S ribosomal protein L23 [Ignavibacteriaceae bacterium]
MKRPLITEKNTNLQDARNVYVFEVTKNANKIEIKDAVEKKFKVRVTNVRTLILKGKKKEMLTRRGRYEGYRADKKKAFVTLHKDDNIDFFGEAS